jgi:hypothetical protein
VKDLSLLVWLSQLGLSVALPPAVLILGAVWLMNQFGWGQWVLWVGIGLGIYCAITGFLSSLRTLSQLTKDKKQDKPVISFNEHN